MFGAISWNMIFQLLRPLRRARSTNSRDRREKVWARMARAAHGQEVMPMKTASTSTPRALRNAAITTRTTRVGMTSTTLVIMFRTSSTIPPR